MSYTYGPVPSRRLGRSLGVDLTPSKTCNFSCIYCQLGRTTNFTNNRRDFFPKEDIAEELEERVKEAGDRVDYITFVGDGEPTLCKSLGWLIDRAKETGISVAVITNGALLYDAGVREDLENADVVLPTLDAGSEAVFRRVNRPRREIGFQKMVDGMVRFAKSYSGRIWVEFMAIKGINDGDEELEKIRAILEDIEPERVYINVPVRPPAEPWVRASERTEEIASVLGGAIEIVLPEKGEFYVGGEGEKTVKKELVEIIGRHPMRRDQIEKILKEKDLPNGLIEELLKTGKIRRVMYKGSEFYVASGALRR
jgi:wyosine [tRNA(Phe)-imidazoG37] synthetase (radical SAM superfamily)